MGAPSGAAPGPLTQPSGVASFVPTRPPRPDPACALSLPLSLSSLSPLSPLSPLPLPLPLSLPQLLSSPPCRKQARWRILRAHAYHRIPPHGAPPTDQRLCRDPWLDPCHWPGCCCRCPLLLPAARCPAEPRGALPLRPPSEAAPDDGPDDDASLPAKRPPRAAACLSGLFLLPAASRSPAPCVARAPFSPPVSGDRSRVERVAARPPLCSAPILPRGLWWVGEGGCVDETARVTPSARTKVVAM